MEYNYIILTETWGVQICSHENCISIIYFHKCQKF